jgi:hypothetical protein
MADAPKSNTCLSGHPGGGRSSTGVDLCKMLRANAHAYAPHLVHAAADEIDRLLAEVDRLKRMMPAHITRILYETEG